MIETPTVSGVPDVILGCNGCLRFIEFKAGTELRPEQKIQSVIIKMTSVPVLLVDKKSPNSFMIGEINYDLFENTLTFDNQTLVNSFEECVEEVWKRLT